MDITNTSRPLPTTCTGVEAWLRELSIGPTFSAIKESGSSPYLFLFGMATVKLAEAHAEIERLKLARARRRVGEGSR